MASKTEIKKIAKMGREDFKKFKPIYIKSCKTIIKRKWCMAFDPSCSDCPLGDHCAKLSAARLAKRYLELYTNK